MNHAKILDCTLRDGAYLVDKTFGNDIISGVIEGLVKTGIDIVEVGFLQNEGFGEGKTVFKNAADAKRFIPENRGNSMFTAFADFSRYSADNLEDYDGTSFDAVRACFFKAERFEAMEFCKKIISKGYKLFVQPVDVLGYSDYEMLELIDMVNEIKPYCFSIVDTFGSMYEDDLTRVFSLVHHNLNTECKIGFHSHNNLQMSSALSQAFLNMTAGLREVVVDTTICGMGRGAGNTPTELVVHYMTCRLGYHYEIDTLLDVIDIYINPIRSRAEWGYSTPLFLAGCYSAHVNNLTYLGEKTSIKSKDVRFILEKIGDVKRKRYDYDLLEKTYIDYVNSDINDNTHLSKLAEKLNGKSVVIIVPGNSVAKASEKINSYIADNNAVVISVNYIHPGIKSDMVLVSNIKRLSAIEKKLPLREFETVFLSNINNCKEYADYIISFNRLVKSGWQFFDNSTIMLLRLLDQLGVKNIGIAGMDGYCGSAQGANYSDPNMERSFSAEDANRINREIADMLKEFNLTKKSDIQVKFITESRFSQEIN